MRGVLGFVRTTVIGGIVFLVPVVLTIVLLKQGVDLAVAIVGPIARLVPLPWVSAAAAATFAAVLSLLILCFLAGLVARTVMAGRLTGALEQRVLARFPVYGLIKSTAEGLVGWQQAEGLAPALLRFDDGWQIGFVTQRLGGGRAAVYVPDAPTPMTGAVFVMEDERIRPLGLSVPETLTMIRSLGAGAPAAIAAALD